MYQSVTTRYFHERVLFYLSSLAWAFGHGLINIFIPIYLWNLGIALYVIFLFFACTQVVRTLAVPLAVKLTTRIGAKHVISISFVFKILFLILFSQNLSPAIFWLSAGAYGFFAAFIDVGYHLHLSKIISDGQRGQMLAHENIARMMPLALAPIVGGYLLSSMGISVTLLVSITFYILASLLLLRSPEISYRHTLNLHLLKMGSVWRDEAANGFYNAHLHLEMVAWPLFIYLIVNGYEKVGFIAAIGLLAGFVIYIWEGRILDHADRKKLFMRISAVHMGFSLLRLLARGFASLAVFNSSYEATARARSLAWTSILQSNIVRHPHAEYILWVEMVGALFSALFLFIFALVAVYLENTSVILAALLASSVIIVFSNMVKYKNSTLPVRVLKSS